MKGYKGFSEGLIAAEKSMQKTQYLRKIPR